VPRFSDFSQRFACPHYQGCPYLEGLPTHWVWQRYQSATGLECQYEFQLQQKDQEIAELKKKLARTEKERDEIQAQCQALHRRQFKARRQPGPGTAAAAAPATKKRGAPVGHPPWNRARPTTFDQTIDVAAPACCPHCQGQTLQVPAPLHEHVQEDIVLAPRPVVTRYRHQQAYCPRCERWVHQPGSNELPGSYLGPVAKATATYLRQQLRVSYRNTGRLFADLFGLRFVPASAYGFDRQAVRRGQPLYADLRQKLRALTCLHADETSWRHAGQNYWVWFGGNAELAAYLWQARRTTEAAQQLLGDKLDAILVSDAFGSYHGLEVKDRQLCLAHLKRNARELEAELLLLKPKAQDADALALCRDVQRWVKALCQQARLSGPWRATEQKAKAAAWLQELNRICAQPLRHERAETFRKRLTGQDQKYLVTFLRHCGVPPTNNLAEQSLRPVVIMRKVIQGTRSDKGLENHSVLRSLLETARRQGRPVRAFFETLFTADTATAQAQLYRNTS
jgi:transposase